MRSILILPYLNEQYPIRTYDSFLITGHIPVKCFYPQSLPTWTTIKKYQKSLNIHVENQQSFSSLKYNTNIYMKILQLGKIMMWYLRNEVGWNPGETSTMHIKD
jgi:hypothetical protein